MSTEVLRRAALAWAGNGQRILKVLEDDHRNRLIDDKVSIIDIKLRKTNGLFAGLG